MTNINSTKQENPISDIVIDLVKKKAVKNEEEFKQYAQAKEGKIAESNLKTVLENFKSDTQALIRDLRSTSEDIQKEGYFLSSLPDKIGDHLINLVPQISEELHKRVLEDFDRQLELRNLKLAATFQRLESAHQSFDLKMKASHATQLENLAELNASFQQAQNTQLRKKILTYITSTIFLFAVALSACWTAFKYFPSKVNINEGNNITVQSSDVTVWGKDFKIIEKIREKEGSKSPKR